MAAAAEHLKIMLLQPGGSDQDIPDDVRDDVELVKAALLADGGITVTEQLSDEHEDKYIQRELPRHDFALVFIQKKFQDYKGSLLTKETWKLLDCETGGSRKLLPVFPYHVDAHSDNIELADGKFISKHEMPESVYVNPLCLRDASRQVHADLQERVITFVKNRNSHRLDHLYKLGMPGRGLAMNYVKSTSLLLGEAGQRGYDAKYSEVLATNPNLQRVEKVIIAVPKDCQLLPGFKVHEYFASFGLAPKDLKSTFEVETPKRKWTYDAFRVPGTNGQKYFTRIEFANIITTLPKMAGADLRDLGLEQLNQEEVDAQRCVFQRETLLLLSMKFAGKFVIVTFTDGADLCRQVQKIVESRDVEMTDATAAAAGDSCRGVCVVYDRQIADTDRDSLTEFEQILTAPRVDAPQLQLLEGVTVDMADDQLAQQRDSTREQCVTIFWISGGQFSAEQKLALSEARSTSENYRKLLAVVGDDAPFSDCFFDATSTLQYEPPTSLRRKQFIERLLYICTHDLPPTYPLVDVHHGLVWTTTLNYLKPVMPGKVANGMLNRRNNTWEPSLRQMGAQLKQSCPGAVFFPNVILMTEKQARDVTEEGTREKTFGEFEGISTLDKALTDAVIHSDMSYLKSVTTQPHLIYYDGKQYIACFEYVRAVRSLAEMRDEELAPIELDKLEQQVRVFNALFRNEACNVPEVRDHCELLDYDADRPEYRDANGQLRLNRILAEFIDAQIRLRGADYYAALEQTFKPR